MQSLRSLQMASLAMCLPCLSVAAHAGEARQPRCSGDFSADRPGLSTDTAVLAPGCQQIEAGYQYSHDDSGVGTGTLPLALYRIGVGDRLELRASWDGENVVRGGDGTTGSANDPAIGAKFRLHDSDTFSLSLLAQLTLPFGSAAATSGHVDPALALLWKRVLSPQTTLSGSLTRSLVSAPDSRSHWQSAMATDLGRDLGNGFGVFVEYAHSKELGQPRTQTIDGGLTWQVGRNLQLDVNGGRNWGGNPGAFEGMGIAWRY